MLWERALTPEMVLLSQVPLWRIHFRSKVTHSPFTFFFYKVKQGAGEIMKPSILPLYPLVSLLTVCTANIISVRCHYGATAAGNVSPAHFSLLQ